MNEVSKPLPQVPPVMDNEQPTRDKSTEIPSRKRPIKRQDDDDDEEFEFFHKFSRGNVRGVIHLITAELKERGTDVEYLMIPLRPEQTNEKLLSFLNQIFPLGNGQPVNEKKQIRVINKTDVWTLFQALKYIWCRLPDSEVVGWKAYKEFKIREKEKDYPRKSFLEIMPQCLASPNHASIVYDFFDLIVTISSNSKKNKMSARKISKMCAIWAFNDNKSSSTDYDFDSSSPQTVNNSIQNGFDQWIPGSDAMFHLLLAFLRSFVPKDVENAKLPRTLKNLLFTNEYPPQDSTAFNSETILTIPLVTLHTDEFSRKPWQLLERCNEMLDFSDHEAFEAREDYALLKSLFKKKNNVEGISRKMSQESRRLMKVLSTKHSTFQAGWAPRKALANDLGLKSKISVNRLDIDDYFIWTWLSTLSYEETSDKRKIFGRSLILEFEFDGFKKWVVFQELDLVLEHMLNEQKKKSTIKNKKAQETTQSDNTKDNEHVSQDIRNITPPYEKFQKEVLNNSVNPSNGPSKGYHTVIDLDARKDKNNMKHKIQKWNPLNNLRKKSGGNAEAKEVQGERKKVKNNQNYDSAPLTDLSDPLDYKLPDIEPDNEGFSIEFPDIIPDPAINTRTENGHQSDHVKVENLEALPTNHNDKSYPAPPLSKFNVRKKPSMPQLVKEPVSLPVEGPMEELSGMVEQMMVLDYANQNHDSQDDILKNVSKFEQYKKNDLQSVDSLVVNSLKISTGTSESLVDSLELPRSKNSTDDNLTSQNPRTNLTGHYSEQEVIRGPGDRSGIEKYQGSNGIERAANHNRLQENSSREKVHTYGNTILPPPQQVQTRKSPSPSPIYNNPANSSPNNANAYLPSKQISNSKPNPSLDAEYNKNIRIDPVSIPQERHDRNKMMSPQHQSGGFSASPIKQSSGNSMDPYSQNTHYEKPVVNLQQQKVSQGQDGAPKVYVAPQQPGVGSGNPSRSSLDVRSAPNPALGPSPMKQSKSYSNLPIDKPQYRQNQYPAIPNNSGPAVYDNQPPQQQQYTIPQNPPPTNEYPQQYNEHLMSPQRQNVRMPVSVPSPVNPPQMGYNDGYGQMMPPQPDAYNYGGMMAHSPSQYGQFMPPPQQQQQQFSPHQSPQQHMQSPYGRGHGKAAAMGGMPPPQHHYGNKRQSNFVPSAMPGQMGPPGGYMPAMGVPVAHGMGAGNKLHGVNMNKKREQKKLYNDIRSGNFGI